MRNVAFSVMLVALALLQVAVVSTELSHSSVQTSAKSESGARQTLASAQTGRNTSVF